MKNERNMSNTNQFNNEDLGCFLPTSLFSEILNDSEIRTQKQQKNMLNKKEFLPFDSPDVKDILIILEIQLQYGLWPTYRS